MLWEEIKSVLQDYFAEKDKEEIDNPITPLVRLQGSSIETSISTHNQSQTVPTTNVDFQKEKNKYNDIRGSVGIEVFYTLKPISEEVFITGSYTDRYGRNHYEEGIASDKLILTIPIGISYPVTNNLFIGYKCGISVYSYSFTVDYAKYSAPYAGLSNRSDFGFYIKDRMFSIKTFVSYTFCFFPELYDDFAIGVSLCIPYFEVGFALDRFKIPSIFFTLQYS